MSGVIVRRYPDQFVPNEYSALAIKNNPTAYGAAVIIDGKMQTVTGGVTPDDKLDVEFVNSTMQEYKSSPITFYFHSSDGAVDMDDVSPHILLSDEEGEPLLVAFVEGNLPGFEKKGSSHPSTTHFVSDWLVAELNKIAEVVDGDLAEIMKYLSKDSFKEKLGKNFVSRGSVTFMTKDACHTLSIGDSGKEFPWGWVSNHYGFGIAKETKEPPKEEPKKKPNMFAKKSTVRESVDPAILNKPKIEHKEETNLKASTTIAKPIYSIKKGRPDATMSRKKRKGWYEARIGYYPAGGDKSCEIEYYVDQTGKLLQWGNIKSMGLDAVGLPKLTNPPRMNARDDKDVEPEHIPETTQPNNQPQKVPTEALPILSPEQRTRTLAFIDRPEIKKLIAEGDIVATAEQAKQMEVKFAEVCQQLGRPDLKLMDFAKIPFPELHSLGEKIGIHGMATFLKNAFNMLAAKLAKEKIKAEKEQEQEVTPTDAPQPEVEVEQVVAAAPAPKRNMFAKRAAA